jgi:HEAT repeat protein
VVRLFGKKEGTSGMFGGDRLNDQIKAEIEALAARQDEESSELLATLAASPFAHGELENRAFAVLGERRDEARIRRILTQARSNCTIAGCLNQMIPLKMEGTFELLRDMLERDGGMFPMGIVAKMERLGDPRAGLVLRDYSNNKEASFFQEALVALGSFDSPETRAHLQKWQKDKEGGPYATTGLYRITGDPKLLKQISKALSKMNAWEAMAITNALEDSKNPEVAKVMKAFTERIAGEDAAKKAKEGKK